MAHGLSCSAACGIFLDQGSNPCPLHWQVDSQPLRHQGSPYVRVLMVKSSSAGSLLPTGWLTGWRQLEPQPNLKPGVHVRPLFIHLNLEFHYVTTCTAPTNPVPTCLDVLSRDPFLEFSYDQHACDRAGLELTAPLLGRRRLRSCGPPGAPAPATAPCGLAPA